MEKILAVILVVVGAIAVAAGMGLLLAFPIKWTWNYVIPYLFNLKELTWGQAWCLMFLSNLLLKSSFTTSSSK